MSPWIARAVVVAASLALVVIRAPHGQRSLKVKVRESRKGKLEIFLLAFAGVGWLLPLLWAATPLLSFADYPLRPAPLYAGIACFAAGLWLLYRSHADLGTNWSVTFTAFFPPASTSVSPSALSVSLSNARAISDFTTSLPLR